MPDAQPGTATAPPARHGWIAANRQWFFPTLIAAVSALTAVIALPQLNRPDAELQVERVVVSADRSSPGASPPTVDVVVRNTGGVVSVVTGMTFDVLAYELVEICEAGGGVEVSATYDVQLPVTDPVGRSVRVDVTQEVPASSVDRFALVMAVPAPEEQVGFHLYRLQVHLEHDGQTRDVGAIVVPVAHVPDEESVSGEGAKYGGDVGQCYADNAAAYERVRAWQGERPAGMPEGP